MQPTSGNTQNLFLINTYNNDNYDNNHDQATIYRSESTTFKAACKLRLYESCAKLASNSGLASHHHVEVPLKNAGITNFAPCFETATFRQLFNTRTRCLHLVSRRSLLPSGLRTVSWY